MSSPISNIVVIITVREHVSMSLSLLLVCVHVSGSSVMQGLAGAVSTLHTGTRCQETPATRTTTTLQMVPRHAALLQHVTSPCSNQGLATLAAMVSCVCSAAVPHPLHVCSTDCRMQTNISNSVYPPAQHSPAPVQCPAHVNHWTIGQIGGEGKSLHWPHWTDRLLATVRSIYPVVIKAWCL